MSNNHKAYVGNLAYSTTEQGLKSFFAECGEITDARVITDRETGRSKGFAFVSFSTKEGLDAAIAKNNGELDGRSLRINQAEDRPRR